MPRPPLNLLLLSVLPFLLAVSPLAAQVATVPLPTEQTRKHLIARRATGRITIDGRLD